MRVPLFGGNFCAIGFSSFGFDSTLQWFGFCYNRCGGAVESWNFYSFLLGGSFLRAAGAGLGALVLFWVFSSG